MTKIEKGTTELVLFAVGIDFPKGMTVTRAVELAKEAIELETGEAAVEDHWQDKTEQHALVLVDVDPAVLFGRSEYHAEKNGVRVQIEVRS